MFVFFHFPLFSFSFSHSPSPPPLIGTEDAEADSWVIITSEDANRAKKALAKELIELVGTKAKFLELPPEASEERFLKLEVRIQGYNN